MAFAPAIFKRYTSRLILLFFAAGIGLHAVAQEGPKAKGSVPRTIILPPRMAVASPATLAVLDSAGRLLPDVVVDLSTGQKITTDITGRARFLAPSARGKLTATIPDRPDHEISASAPVVELPDPATASPAEGSSAEVHVTSYPRALTLHDRFAIEGIGFRGIADSNQVFLSDQVCLVMASSPLALVVLPGPHIAIGENNLRVSVAGHDTEKLAVSAVSLEFSGPSEAPDAGTQGQIILSVRGDASRLPVEVFNGSPAIIQFPHGNVQRVLTSGGEQNTAPVELKFLAAGNYTLTARLVPSDAVSPSNK